MDHWTAPPKLIEIIDETARSVGIRPKWGTQVGLNEVLETLMELERRWRGDGPLALEIAECLPLLTLGELGLAMRASPTLGSALGRLARFHTTLTSLVHIDFDETTGKLGLRYRLPRRPCVPLIHEIGMTMLVRIGREVTGTMWTPYRVQFTRAATHAACWKTYLGVKPEVGERAELTIEADVLGLKTRCPDVMFLDFFDSRATLQLESASRTVVAELRAWLADRLDHAPTSAECARSLGMSRRTLQRHLSAFDTSYTSELEQLRRQRSLELLGLGDRVQEVALALGYSDSSAFARAYRRWFGCSPRDSRS